MAKITTGSTFGLSRTETEICKAIFYGEKTTEEIAKTYFKVRDANGNIDMAKVASAKRKIGYIKRKPQFQECYAALVREEAFDDYGRAMRKLASHVNDPNPWVSMNAATNVLSRNEKYVMGEESNEITVRIEGAPDLGTPDSEEPDAVTD
jgi:hypothetical protein